MTATTTATTTSTATSQSLALAGKARDQVEDVLEAFNGCIGLQRFISPEYADEAHAGVVLSRAELGAVSYAVNDVMRRRIFALADSMTLLEAQLTIDASQASQAP